MPTPITREAVVEILQRPLGEPSKSTKKVVGWRLKNGDDLVVQLDSLKSEDQAYVWIPAASKVATPISSPCDLYGEGKSRHSNVSRFETLGPDRWALRFSVKTTDDLLALLKSVVNRRSGKR